MDICFNSLIITAPEITTEFILANACVNHRGNPCRCQPKDFRFSALLKTLAGDSIVPELDDIWINWIECKSVGEQRQLMIEFESREQPPTPCIEAIVEGLKQQQLAFSLQFQYRRENESWEGEMSASSETSDNH